MIAIRKTSKPPARHDSDSGWRENVPDDDGEAVLVEPEPEWRTRALLPEEVARVRDSVQLWLLRNKFTYQHIAQVVEPEAHARDPEKAADMIRGRLRRMAADFDAAGFRLGPIP